jgi:nickel-type superoxide dismutase maturation protease
MRDEAGGSSLIFFIMEIPTAGWKDRILFFLGRRDAFRVEGNSMMPTLNDGDVVLVRRTRRVKVGNVILAKHPYQQSVKVLKRISEINEQGRLVLTGDNPEESTDSRTFGSISSADVMGKVIGRLR